MADFKTFLKDIENEHNIHIKVKGGKVNLSTCFSYSLVILKKALINYFVFNKSIYDTLKENQELRDYQIIKNTSVKTRYVDATNNVVLPDKVLRIFPLTKGGIKLTTHGGDKIPDVPEDNVLLYKGDIRNMTINDIPNFDINYYINAFNKALADWN